MEFCGREETLKTRLNPANQLDQRDTIQLHNNSHQQLRQNQPQQQQPHQLLDDIDEQHMFNKLRLKLFVSEFIGTFTLVYLSQSAVTSFELTGTQNDTINRQTITILANGLAYLFATFLTLNSSGAHLNPVYSFSSALFGYTSWGRAINYITAQYLGSFFAAIFLHATYSDKLAQRHTEGLLTGANATYRAHGHILSTGKFFSSYPPTDVSMTQISISYTLATAHLMLLVIAIHESRLLRLPKFIRPFYLACVMVMIQSAFQANGGPVLNPAQDFSPRLYISLFGWGSAAFNLYHFRYWWFCGLLMPHLGAVIGFGVYQILTHVDKISEINRCNMGVDYRLTRDSIDY